MRNRACNYHLFRLVSQVTIVAAGLLLSICFLFADICTAGELKCPPVGAIRWDAWHGDDGKVGLAVEKTLTPSQWHYRIPFCGQISESGKVDIECDTPEVVQQEIQFASRSGLSYWAFLAYDNDDPMSRSLNFYLSSPNKSMINFALIAQFGRWGNRETFKERNSYYIKLMKDPSYQRIQGGRPLFFIFNIDEDRLREIWGGVSGFKYVIDNLRREAKASGVGNPFIVVMDFKPERAQSYVETFGFDAISSYAVHPGQAGAPYAKLAEYDRKFWERSRRTGAQVVPIVMSGWDDRPRAASPAPWQMKRAEKLGAAYFSPPTAEELALHLDEAMRWSVLNSKNVEPNPVIIYAWNEFDEGGWLAPTLVGGSARIDAIEKLIYKKCIK